MKDTIEFKKQATEWKKVFTTFKNDKDSVTRSMNNSNDQWKKRQTTQWKMGKRLKEALYKRGDSNSQSIHGECSTSLATSHMQIKTTLLPPYPPATMFKSLRIPSVDKGDLPEAAGGKTR